MTCQVTAHPPSHHHPIPHHITIPSPFLHHSISEYYAIVHLVLCLVHTASVPLGEEGILQGGAP